MSGAAGFLAGLTPAAPATPARPGADAGRAGAPARPADDPGTFAAAMVGALLQTAPAEVRAALARTTGSGRGELAPGTTPDALAEASSTPVGGTSPEGAPSAPSIAELMARLDGPDAAGADPVRDVLAELGGSTAVRRLLADLPAGADAASQGSGVDTRRILAGMGVDPATVEALAAPAAAPAEGTADVHSVDRDVHKLHPELQAKLARVQERMASEYGHTVELTEGVRSGARQDHLFAQGRTRPGDVVTWTRASKHESGRAADVMIDGGWSDPAAFERLHRIAREEGLATLGPRDRGHLELPGTHGAVTATGRRTPPEGEGSAAPLPRPRWTGPARAAQVAGTAQVAQVARPGVGTVSATPVTPSPQESAATAFAPAGEQKAGDPGSPPSRSAPGTPVQGQTSTDAATPGPDAAAPRRGADSAGTRPAPATPELAGTRPDFDAVRRAVSRAEPPSASAAPDARPAPASPVDARTGAPAEALAARAATARTEGATPAPTGAGEGATSSTATASAVGATLSGDARDAGTSRDRSRGEGSDESAPRSLGERGTSGRRTEAFSLDGARASRPEMPAAPAPAADAGRPTAAARAEQVAELRDQALNLRGDRVNLRVEHPDGEVTRIRMATGDRRVDAELRPTDPVHARRLRQQVAELSARLEEQGLRLGDVAVRDLRMPGRAEAASQGSTLESLLRQGLQAGSESSDTGASGRDAQQRQQDRQGQGFGSGRHRQPRDEWTPRDDSRQQTPWETWKEEIR